MITRTRLITGFIIVLLVTTTVGLAAPPGDAQNPATVSSQVSSPPATVELTPAENAVVPGNTTNFSVVVANTSATVGSFTLNITLAPSAVASVESVTIAGSPVVSNVTQAPTGIQVTAAGLNRTTDQPLVNITVRGDLPGNTAVQLDTRQLTTTTGTSIDGVTDQDASLTVTETTVSVSPETSQLQPNETTNVSVVATSSKPIGAFSFQMRTENLSVSNVEQVTLSTRGVIANITRLPNETVVVAVAGANLSTGDTIQLASVRLGSDRPGTTEVRVSQVTLSSPTGVEIPVGATQDGTVQTVAPSGPNLEATALSAPSSVAYGEPVTFAANVTNRGTGAGTKTVAFTADVDGDGTPETVGQQTVSLNASETTRVDVGFQFDTAQGTGHVGSGFNSSSLVGEAVTLSVGVGGETATQTQSVNVNVTAPPAVGGSGTATDPDGDGIYEDVDGNGRESLSDVFDLFQQLGQAKQVPGAFDLNGDGEVTVVDVQLLFFEI